MIFPASGAVRSGLQTRSPQLTEVTHFPAPNLGINAVQGLSTMDPRDAIFSYNLYPGQYGLKVRPGYAEFATNVGTNGGRTIIPYKGSTTGNDRLFACSENGIFNISAGGSGAWVAAITFGTQNATSGYGQWQAYTTLGGHFLLYCDETNGYFTYTEATTTWLNVAAGAGATDINGVNPDNLVSCCVFKERVWFVERDSASAWYLPVGAVYGTVTEFNFGNKFRRGGFLVNLYSWTVDGGEGVDDYLVAVSSNGDVIVYRGNDPATATDWFQHGSWFIGQPPSGRRVAGAFGGELYLLSAYGVLPLSRLLSGQVVQDIDTYLSKRITPLIKEEIRDTAGSRGWEIKLIPNENLLIVSVPEQVGEDRVQFVLSLNSDGWGVYRDLPYFTGDAWNNDFYFSDADSIIYIHSGTLDNVNLAETSFDNIEFSLLTSFQDPGPHGTFKRVKYIRATFIGGGEPGFTVQANYDYNLDEAPALFTPGSATGATWDGALWDVGLWGGVAVVTDKAIGGSGQGVVFAVALRGEANVETTLIEFDVLYESGGLL